MLYNDDRELVGVDWSTEASLKDNPDPLLKLKGKITWEDTSVAVRCGYGRCNKCACINYIEDSKDKCKCGHSFNEHQA
jgi:hypothetical protein